MGDKGKREDQKKGQLTLKEKRQQKKEKVSAPSPFSSGNVKTKLPS